MISYDDALMAAHACMVVVVDPLCVSFLCVACCVLRANAKDPEAQAHKSMKTFAAAMKRLRK
jgi:hypothetical protein